MLKTDVLLFGGQSNMMGETETLLEDVAVPGAREYRWLTDTAVPLRDPVGENVRNDWTEGYPLMESADIPHWNGAHIVGSACYGHTTLVPSFCRAYIAGTGRQVLAAHIAKGSTVIAQWLPGTDGYRMLVEKGAGAVKKAKETGTLGRVYFVWLQGESDAIAGNSKQQYKAQLIQLAEALRADVGIDRFCVIRVGRFVWDDRDMEIITAQDEVCRERGDFVMLTDITTQLNELPEYMNPNVDGHYSAAGQQKLGTVAGEALADYQINA